MPMKRVREVVWEAPSPAYFLEKARNGWTLVALEWEREDANTGVDSGTLPADVPYGLRIASTLVELEENPKEREILVEMLGLIVKDDVRFSMIADSLNQKGFRTRQGKRWTPADVFDLLPRLVEVAPTILSSDEWALLKARM